jgi:hypothetical protein
MNDEQNNINELIIEIQRLIDITTKEYETQKQRLNFLFKQSEKARNLRTYNDNPQLLNAFLTLQGFYYKTDFDLDQMTEKIFKEVEMVRKKIEPNNLACLFLQDFSYEALEKELDRRKKLGEEAVERVKNNIYES